MPSAKRRRTSQKIAIFNHKGGVGKTTLAVNVAAALSSLGKRVLLVDSDPQCNLTAYLIEELVVNKLLDQSDSPHGRTIWSSLKPVLDGTSSVPHRASPLETRSGLFLIPGDIQLSQFETSLNDLFLQCFQRQWRGFYGVTALSSMVNEAVTKIQADYVFYDCGPNIGPLNRAIILDSDWFVIPSACDAFSLRALTTLGFTLEQWIRDWGVIRDFAPDEAPLLNGKPKLLGYVPQMFRPYRRQLTQATSRYLARFESRIYSDVVKRLAKVGYRAAPTRTSLKLGEVPDYRDLVLKSQEVGVPIGELTGVDKRAQNAAVADFVGVARRLLSRTKG